MFGPQYYKIFLTTLPDFEMFIERVYVKQTFKYSTRF